MRWRWARRDDRAVDDAPLIVTLALDDESQARFDALRRTWFPPERNWLSAHVTLFHALPAHALADVLVDVCDVVGREPFVIEVTGPRSLGRGVAYDLRSAELAALHAELVRRWEPLLVAQDLSLIHI